MVAVALLVVEGEWRGSENQLDLTPQPAAKVASEKILCLPHMIGAVPGAVCGFSHALLALGRIKRERSLCVVETPSQVSTAARWNLQCLPTFWHGILPVWASR
jgi:hypothetical protein